MRIHLLLLALCLVAIKHGEISADCGWNAKVIIRNDLGEEVKIVGENGLVGNGRDEHIDTLLCCPGWQTARKFYVAYFLGMPLCILRASFFNNDSVGVSLETLPSEPGQERLHTLLRTLEGSITGSAKPILERAFVAIKDFPVYTRTFLVDVEVKSHGQTASGSKTFSIAPEKLKIVATAEKLGGQSKCIFKFSPA